MYGQLYILVRNMFSVTSAFYSEANCACVFKLLYTDSLISEVRRGSCFNREENIASIHATSCRKAACFCLWPNGLIACPCACVCVREVC